MSELTPIPEPSRVESPNASFRPSFRKLGSAVLISAVCGAVVFAAFEALSVRKKRPPPGHEIASDLHSLSVMLELYRYHNGSYPTTAQGLGALVDKPAGEPEPRRWTKLMSELPQDRWGKSYGYEAPGRRSGKGFDVYSHGKDGVAGTADDIGNW